MPGALFLCAQRGRGASGIMRCRTERLLMAHQVLHHTLRAARRIGITIAGVIVILAGVAMLVLPGPGILTIVLGLMILGSEFEFARRWVATIKMRTRQALDYARRRGRRPGPPSSPQGTS